ncbi:MAG: response regulator [Parachlamydiales bacterium]|nr:response regulator [Parachlamydiales bacterium]
MPDHKLSKLLIVDDDHDCLTIAKYCLENMSGVTIKYASSGEEALQEAILFLPDLILLDAMMPKMDGISTLKAMRLIPALASIPVVFFTAKVQKEDIASFLRAGAIDVITKPFDPLTLSSTILAIWKKTL